MAATLTIETFKEALKGAFGYLESDARNMADFIERLFQRTLVLQVPADGDGDFTVAGDSLVRIRTNCTITAAYFLTAGTITANGTNYTTLALNKYDGAGGAGAVAASRATDTVATDDVAALVPWALDNSGTAANLSLSAGNVLGVTGTKASAGVAVPAGVVVVNVKERT